MNRTKKMHELKLLDNVTKSLPIGNEEQETNETNNGEENRKRITLILNECHVPEELEQRTLQAMAAMRDVQAQEAARVKAQKEVQKAVLRESHQFNKKTLFRGVAIAAVLTIMVTVTPPAQPCGQRGGKRLPCLPQRRSGRHRHEYGHLLQRLQD